MKPTTESILKWLNSKPIQDQLSQFKQTNPTYAFNETTVDETFGQFELNKDLLLKSIEKNILDEQLSFTKRNQINQTLKNISTHLTQIAQFKYLATQPNAVALAQAIINGVNSLTDIIDGSKLQERLSGFSDYANETKELSKIKKVYNSLVKDIEKANENNKESQSIYDNLKSITDNLLKTNKELESEKTKTIKIKDEIVVTSESVKKQHQDIEDKKVKITAFFNNIVAYTEVIEQSEKDIKKLKDKTQESIDIFKNNTSTIIEENTNLQTRIKELLQGANAGRLYKSFHWRKRQLEKGIWLWFSGVIAINTIIALYSLIFILEIESGHLAFLKNMPLDGIFFLKLLAGIPLIVLDWFLIQQYNSRKALIEEYTFKSAISLSLLAYNDLVKEQDKDQSLAFIINTVEKIYASPFKEKNLTKKELEVLHKLADKGLEQFGRVAEKTVHK